MSVLKIIFPEVIKAKPRSLDYTVAFAPAALGMTIQ